ncbi:MAG: MerR family transcriptional regulator [Sandaracinaceae bacterium]
MHDDEPTLTIAELAERGGVSRRTVRYYVQRGLLPSPGLGRGAQYGKDALERLIRIRDRQAQGVSLDAIASELDGDPPPAVPVAAPSVEQSTWTRVAIADGVELHLRDRRLDAQQLERVMTAIAGAIASEDERGRRT